MASSRKIATQWHLTDGVTGSFAVQATEVCAALLEAGEIRNPDFGLRAREIEWIANREWTFETRFEKPETEDERIRLRLEKRFGEICVRLNGGDEILPQGDMYELTGDVQEGENILTITVLPAPHVNAKTASVRMGFEGARLETYNYIRLEKCSFVSGEASLQLEAFLSGRYRFVYTVSREGELIARTEIQERLPAARRQIVHVFDMGEADGFCDVMFAIERSGIGCDTVRTTIFAGNEEARQIVETDCFADIWLDLGAQAVSGSFTEREKGEFAKSGLQTVPELEGISYPAMVAPEKLIRYADGQKYWPQDCALFRARKTPEIDVEEYRDLFSHSAGEEPERLARLTRYMQAEYVRACAQDAREEEKVFVAAKAAEAEFAYVSDALVESDGYRRPAYWALKGVWQNVHAFARAKSSYQPGENAILPVVLLRKDSFGSLKVRCVAYDMQGNVIEQRNIDARFESEFALTMPEQNGIVLLRITVEDAYGKIVSRCDRIVCVSDSKPLEPLWNPERTRISRRDHSIFNEGACIALAVSTNGYYGALLPGESIPSEGVFECLNAIL